MAMINAMLQDLNTAIKYRQDIPTLLPPLDAYWAAEVDINHIMRIMDVIAMSDSVQSNWLKDHCITSSQFSKGDHSILYSTKNLVTNRIIPQSSIKYLSRMFYIPHTARDIVDVLIHHSSFCDLMKLNQKQGHKHTIPVFKIMTYPKDIESILCDGLERHAVRLQNPSASSLDGLVTDPSSMPFNLTKSMNGFTHLICCVYSKFEGLFRWGIVSKETARSMCLMFDDLFEARNTKNSMETSANAVFAVPKADETDAGIMSSGNPYNRAGSSVISKSVVLPPLCRAYDKIAEVVEVHFVRWGWATAFLEQRAAVIGIDVGASPGGWSQFMLEIGCSRVIAIDPGLLAPAFLDVYPESRLVHVPHTVQASATQVIIEELTLVATTDAAAPGPVPSSSRSSFSDGICSGCARGGFMVACDMNVDPEAGIDLVGTHVLRHLFAQNKGSGAVVYLIFTLKLYRHPKQDYIDKMICCVTSYLIKNGFLSEDDSDRHNNLHCLHANANSINERTLVYRMQL